MMALTATRTFLLTLMALIVTLSATGCASRSAALQSPEIQLVDAEVVRAKLLEQEFLLRFRIDNPNDSPLSLRQINYQLNLNDIPLATDQRNINLNVPAHQYAYLELPVFTNLWRHLKTLISAIKQPTEPVQYLLQAEVSTGRLFRQSFNVQRNGTLTPDSF